MPLGDRDRVVTVAEIGINHNGDLDIARKLIDIAVECGCDVVKFQKRNVELVYTREELDRPRESPWGKTNRDQKMGLEFNQGEYDAIAVHCGWRGIDWFASCWDESSVDVLDKYDAVEFHKVASALLTDEKLLRRIAASGRKSILSTGMSTPAEVGKAIAGLGDSLDTVMHCTSTYPTSPDEMNLNVVNSMRRMRMLQDMEGEACRIPHGVRVGFSNHYSGLLWVPISMVMGAQVLEFHITLDRTMYGTDQAASIEPDGVRKLVEHVKLTERMLGDGFKRVYDSELPILEKLRRV